MKESESRKHLSDFLKSSQVLYNIKSTDKVAAIEEVDNLLPNITALNPDVIIVTGDHSTPALLKSHSWHPVPFMLYSSYCRPDDTTEFSERSCTKGSLGRFPGVEIMPLALANALKLTKFGA